MKEKWLKHKTIYSLFLVLTFLFYGNTLKNKYSLDDEYITVTNYPIKGQQYVPNNKLVKNGFKSIPKIWVSRYAHDAESSFDYRPVVTTSFAIEYGIFGQNPFISHLINVILYFILICVLFDVLMTLFKDQNQQLFLAFATSLLFLIHPIHTEVVASLKCRDELLACLFSLLAAKKVFSLLEKPSFKTATIIIVFLFLAYLSKLSAVLIMAAIPLMVIFYRKVGIKKTLLTLLALVILFKLFGAFANRVPTEELVRNYYAFENPMYTQKFTFLEKLWVGVKTFGFYIQMLFFPYPLRFYYGSNMFDFKSIINSNVIATGAFVIASAIYYWKKRDRDFLFSFLLLGLLIFPFLNIYATVAGIVGDRLAFIPSIGFCMMISVVLKPFFQNFNFNKVSILFSKPLVYFTPIIFISMIYTINRNTNWSTKLSLFEHDIPYLINSAKANSLIANEYFEMIQSPNKKYSPQVVIQKTLKHYSLAVTSDSSLYSAYNNAGVVYYSYLSDIPKAKNLFKIATKHKEKYAQAYENLGNCYKKEKDTIRAIEAYKMAIIYGKYKTSAYLELINMLFEFKEYQKALNITKIANSHFPNNYELTAQEANCYFMKGDTAMALVIFEEAYKLNSNHELAQFISKKYKAFRNIEKSEFYGSK